jgi:ATP-dependent exoDNAse (exonuclease V) beta subunit
MGYLPVKYSSGLKESLFSEDYQLEHARVYLDNLNLLYVAMTRAEHGLMVFAPASEARSFKNNYKHSVSRLLYESITGSQELASGWSVAALTWRSGDLTVSTDNVKEETDSTALATYTTSQWRGKLVVKKTAPKVSGSEVESERQKIDFGIHLHAAFSKIRYAGDIPRDINANEKESLEQSIHTLLESPQVADWFSPGWEVRNEAHTLLPGGQEYRIDRLLLKGKQAVVIDYKTGAPKKEDQKQVGEYCLMLNQMGFTTEGYLLYLTDADIVSVVPPKLPRKKNQNQLGLDL